MKVYEDAKVCSDLDKEKDMDKDGERDENKGTHTRSDADSGRGGATVIDSFTPKFQDIGEPGLGSWFLRFLF